MRKHKKEQVHLVPVHATDGDTGTQLAPDRQRRPWKTVAIIAVLAAVGAAWVVAGLDAATDETGSDPHSRRAASDRQPGDPEAGPQRRAILQCRETRKAVRDVLAAAAPSMAQWKLHIDAMNQLVAGEITWDQASAFWEQTRVGAHHRYADFAAADGRLEPVGTGCPAATGFISPRPRTVACELAVLAEEETLQWARTTLARWHHHIVDMDRLRAGTLDPAKAQQMWLSTWRAGAAELENYRLHEQISSDLRCQP